MEASIHSVHAASRKVTHAIQNVTPIKAIVALSKHKDSVPKVPDPKIFADLSQLPGKTEPPSIAQCAVHLKFLECLFVLRQKVLKSEELDKVFDIEPNYKIVKRKGVDTKLKDETLWERRQVKWHKFVEFAVVRFVAWWEKLREIVEVKEGDRVVMGVNELPPLDVLMVWHSFLLNPRFFRINALNKLLCRIDFPWVAINNCIKSANWTFTLTPTATTTFSEKIEPAPDLFAHISTWTSHSSAQLKSILKVTAFPPKSPSLRSIANTFHPLLNLYTHASTNPKLSTALSSAVQRQTSFITKMDGKLWIHSPSLTGTLTRAQSRYNRFLQLYAWYPNTMFVPTLDIDLIWHTHQCSPGAYYLATMEKAGKFLNHDDSIEDAKLGDGYMRTRELWRVRFAEEYAVCGCWDCEALMDVVEDVVEDVDGKDLEERVRKGIEKVKVYREKEAVVRRREEILEELKKRGQGVIPS